MSEQLPTRAGVEAAAARIQGLVRTTPLIPLTVRDEQWLVKAESLQLGGAFKLRGAFNRLLRLTDDERSRGVVAFSSGNHAQGVARAAATLGMPALIVMPADAPAVKIARTRALGAEVRLYDRMREDRIAIGAAISAERGAVLVPPFDDVDVIEGQGTAGLEAQAQADGPIELVVTPCGGGGLAAGLALALPQAEVVIVEPEGWDDMGESLRRGAVVPVAADPPKTMLDALLPLRVADRTFAVLEQRGATGLAVSDAESAEAMRFAFAQGLVVEPGGAAALAAVLAGKVRSDGRRGLIMLSGSCVDPALFAEVVAA